MYELMVEFLNGCKSPYDVCKVWSPQESPSCIDGDKYINVHYNIISSEKIPLGKYGLVKEFCNGKATVILLGNKV